MVDDPLLKLSLNFAVGTKITREHVRLAYEEAEAYPYCSWCRKVFLSYARRLENECARQEKLDSVVDQKGF
jgi:hypothetical protein